MSTNDSNLSELTPDHRCNVNNEEQVSAADPLLSENKLQVPKANGRSRVAVPDEKAKEVEEFTPPDGGWGWVVCFASFWVNGTVFGMLNTFGILLPYIKEELGGDDSNVLLKISLIASISLFTTFFMSMISSIAADQLGIRKVGVVGGILAFIGILTSSFVKNLEWMYLTYGILFGCGSSFIYSGSLVILGHYFKKRMGLVNGLVTTGSAVFTIALPYLLKYLLDARGLAFTLQVESGILATTVLCSLAFKPLIKHKRYNEEPQKTKPKSFLSTESIQVAYTEATGKCTDCFKFVKRYLNVDIWKNRGYVIWSVAITFSLFGYFVPLVHINNYVKTSLKRDGELAVMIIGGVSGLGRLLSGKLGDMDCVNRIRFQQIAFVLYGATTLVLPFVKVYEVLIAICVILGIMDGFFVCLLGPIAFDLVGPHNASQAMGFLLAMISFPLMMGPMIGGWIYDETQNYEYAFYFAGVPPLIGAAIMFFIPKIAPRTEGGTQAEAFASISHWSLNETPTKKVRGHSALIVNTTINELENGNLHLHHTKPNTESTNGNVVLNNNDLSSDRATENCNGNVTS